MAREGVSGWLGGPIWVAWERLSGWTSMAYLGGTRKPLCIVHVRATRGGLVGTFSSVI